MIVWGEGKGAQTLLMVELFMNHGKQYIEETITFVAHTHTQSMCLNVFDT